jgi:hypothetical protein
MREVLEYPSGTVSCDLSYVVALEAKARFEEFGKEATTLFISADDPQDFDVALEIIQESDLHLAIMRDPQMKKGSWSIGDAADRGFGSEGA